jgi:DNA-binding NtrC family response regulator
VSMRADFGIVGESVAVRTLRATIEQVAPSALPILIEGQTGAGKELVAQALHALSGRRGQLVAFNVCAIGDSMFEDALFGHVRGAFTGAVHDSPGFLREADGGTAFFDEISGLGLGFQTKLLRAIETGEFRPVGARSNARSDFRLVSATNEAIRPLVASGRFRADLMHRIAAMRVHVPPLRDRLEDIPLLVDHFLGSVASVAKPTSAAILFLQGHDWPGNVRELKNVVQSCAMMGGVTAERARSVITSRRDADQSVEAPGELRGLADALRRHGGDTVAVASELGVHRSTVYRWMRTLSPSSPRPF